MALTKIGTIQIHHYLTASEYAHTILTNNTPKNLAIGFSDRSSHNAASFPANQTLDKNTLAWAIISGQYYDSNVIGIQLAKNGNNMTVFYMNENYEFVNEVLETGTAGSEGTTIDIPIFSGIGSAGASSINISTVDPNTAIEALVDGIMTEINNTPKTVNITDGNVVIDVASHIPKDKYTVQVNNGDNMLRIIDGSAQYTSFPASIPVEANKTLTAYGEPDREITINYTNTGKPVITNT